MKNRRKSMAFLALLTALVMVLSGCALPWQQSSNVPENAGEAGTAANAEEPGNNVAEEPGNTVNSATADPAGNTANATDPAEPANTANTADPAEPANNADPADPAKPAESGEPAKGLNAEVAETFSPVMIAEVVPAEENNADRGNGGNGYSGGNSGGNSGNSGYSGGNSNRGNSGNSGSLGSSGNSGSSGSSGSSANSGNSQLPAGEVPISSFYYTQNLTLNPGGSGIISLSALPENTTQKIAVEWSNGNSSVTSLSNIGRGSYYGEKASVTVNGVAKGSDIIRYKVTVYNSDGSVNGTDSFAASVTVADPGSGAFSGGGEPADIPLQALSLDKPTLSMEVRNNAQLKIIYEPSNTTEKKASWNTSDESIVEVNSGGRNGEFAYIYAKAEGTAVITACVGDKTASCTVTVTGFVDNGTYRDASDAYSAANAFRTDPANQWYWNQDNETKVETPGLGALVRDAGLEETARLRAKEAWIQYYINGVATHARLDGSSCFTAYPSYGCAENLAWGYGSGSSVVNGWAENNDKYEGQGHRRNMLGAGTNRVGIACYIKDGKTCWAMCLGY